MTFTVVARSNLDGALGICLATGPYGVASRCPHVRGGVAAISSQCHSNPKLGLIGLDLAQNGMTPDEILTALRNFDPHFAYRQLGIVTDAGEVGVHSGANGRDYTGHATGDGFLVMGNAIAGRQVVEAMHEAYLGQGEQDFEERLLRTLEAGYGAGGQTIGQRSAGLIVVEAGRHPRTDLRIDMANPLPEAGGDAVRTCAGCSTPSSP